MRLCLRGVVLLLIVLLCSNTYASLITGTSTATQLTADDLDSAPEGVEEGWYKYTMNLTWDLDNGLSHWDLILKLGCAELDHLFEFGGFESSVSGQSTSEDYPEEPFTVNWFAYLNRNGDPPAGITEPLLKYEYPALDDLGNPIPPTEEAGEVGYGVFWYYCNVIPQNGSDGNGAPWVNALVAKAGSNIVWGNLSGDAPSCMVIPNEVPEPATIILLGLGGLALVRKRRAKKIIR
ncbi:MAG: PEP-CTERM sorting domain-containing protein [Planctomycetota bacterium]